MWPGTPFLHSQPLPTLCSAWNFYHYRSGTITFNKNSSFQTYPLPALTPLWRHQCRPPYRARKVQESPFWDMETRSRQHWLRNATRYPNVLDRQKENKEKDIASILFNKVLGEDYIKIAQEEKKVECGSTENKSCIFIQAICAEFKNLKNLTKI